MSGSLYQARHEHDSCGFGLIANLDDRPSAWLVETALVALERMSHRGAVGADGLSGDGCGVLIRKPDAFLRQVAAEAGIALGTRYAAGNVFLPHDPGVASEVRTVLSEELAGVGLAIAGWREVPLVLAECGAQAQGNLPRIEQVFVAAPDAIEVARFERDLFLARRRAERRLAEVPEFYVVSLSQHALGYKGMVLPAALPRFFPDLVHPALSSSVVLFHQRFSTNTAPRWPLAQPFRFLAHNGEINTIEGNRRWAIARVAKWRTEALDLAELTPPVSLTGSDSESLDNMLELLLMGGMDLLQAMRILIPPTSSSLEHEIGRASCRERVSLNV